MRLTEARHAILDGILRSAHGAPERALYQRVFEHFPTAWVEDAAQSPETSALLTRHAERLSWDAPVTSLAALRALGGGRPAAINVMPSFVR